MKKEIFEETKIFLTMLIVLDIVIWAGLPVWQIILMFDAACILLYIGVKLFKLDIVIDEFLGGYEDE